MDFDLGLAVREDSENPVYYIQYAYARICSLLKTMADEGRSVPAADKADLSLLSGEQERALIKELANFSEEIRMAARDYDPSYINRYLMRLAGAFHRFYNACRIKGEADDVANARLLLAAGDPSGARQRPDDPRPEQAREDVSTHYIQVYNKEEDSRSAALFSFTPSAPAPRRRR